MENRPKLYGILWRQVGEEPHLMYRDGIPCLFTTKKAAKQSIGNVYGYIATRKDLRNPPHNWRMPIPIPVTVTPVTPIGVKKGAYNRR